jgi:hypothetical protein
MDLYDFGNTFSSYVPVKALKSPLLRYSAIAIAAKQLGRVKGVKAIMGGVCRKQASTELYPNCEQTNWFYIAAKYYDRAITYLREGLVSAGSSHINRSSLESPSESEINRRRLIECTMQPADEDDLLAATSILSVYEFMDDSSTEWSRSVFATSFTNGNFQLFTGI